MREIRVHISPSSLAIFHLANGNTESAGTIESHLCSWHLSSLNRHKWAYLKLVMDYLSVVYICDMLQE